MSILFVDDVAKYDHLKDKYDIIQATNKVDALNILKENDHILAVFVSVTLNNDFLETIRSIRPNLPLYLINNTKSPSDIRGLIEHSMLINGYLLNPHKHQLEKKIDKVLLKHQYILNR